MTSSVPSRRRLELAAADLDLDRVARAGLAVVVLASAALTFHLTRGGSFSVDDWTWIEFRRANTLHAFLAPYNGHLSLVPIAIYRVMFALAGIGNFAAYRVLLILVTSLTGLIVYAYARHRVGSFLALLVTTVLMFLGAGWNDILQPFQIAWMIAGGAGILALSLLDRRRTRTDAIACLLVMVSLASTSVGVALTVGIAVDIAITRRRWADLWIVALPGLLYVIWAVAYHSSGIMISSITATPFNVIQTTAAGTAGVVGLSGISAFDLTGEAVTLGASLLVLTVAAVAMRASVPWDWRRFLSLGSALITFSLLVTFARSLQSPFESRYMYVTCVLVALMLVELARGLTLPRRWQLVLAAVTLVSVLSGIGELRDAANFFRQWGTLTDATLGALQLDRGTVNATTTAALQPLGSISAGQYFAVRDALGSPADTVAQIRRANPGAQLAADAQSLADRDVTFMPGPVAGAPPSAAPQIEAASNGMATPGATCVSYAPSATLAPAATSTITLRLVLGRVSVSAQGADTATLSVRRFSPTFSTLGTIQPHGSAVLTVTADRVADPWHLQVQSTAPVRICGLAGA